MCVIIQIRVIFFIVLPLTTCEARGRTLHPFEHCQISTLPKNAGACVQCSLFIFHYLWSAFHLQLLFSFDENILLELSILFSEWKSSSSKLRAASGCLSFFSLFARCSPLYSMHFHQSFSFISVYLRFLHNNRSEYLLKYISTLFFANKFGCVLKIIIFFGVWSTNFVTWRTFVAFFAQNSCMRWRTLIFTPLIATRLSGTQPTHPMPPTKNRCRAAPP